MNADDLFNDYYHKPEKCESCEVMLNFTGLGEYSCPKCGKKYYDDYGIVRNYLDQHKQATVSQISENTGVKENEITRMLREERLEVTVDSRTYLTCEACGKSIRSGRFCAECAQIAKAAKEKKKKERDLLEKKDLIHGLGKAMSEDDGKKRFNRDR